MKYRTIKRTGWKVSEIGLGCEHLEGKPFEVVDEVVNTALDNEINIFDIFMPAPAVRSNIGKAIGGRRDRVYLQGHIGNIFENGQYTKTTDLKKSEEAVYDFLRRFNTDYIDIGMMHCIDTPRQLSHGLSDGYMELLAKLKQKGVFRSLALSSHSATAAIRLVETGVPDVVMFSVNPVFDMMDPDLTILEMVEEELWKKGYRDMNPDRMRFYRLCEERGVAITVMKAFAGGRLLKKELTPLTGVMTTGSLIHYALDRPAVVSIMVGCANGAEVLDAVSYYDKSDEERDYTAIALQPRHSLQGRCMYCNHCLPCPANIDVAAVTQAYDAARDSAAPLGQNPAAMRYYELEHNAEDCIACGSCESQCPFGVKVIENMEGAKSLFAQINK